MKADTEAFITGIVVGLVFGFILTSLAWGALKDDTEERWTQWQECIQTRSGGDASMEWCDETFGNPARSDE